MAFMLIRTGYISETIANRRIEFVRTRADQERYARELAEQGIEPHEERVEILKATCVGDLQRLEESDKRRGLTII